MSQETIIILTMLIMISQPIIVNTFIINGLISNSYR